MQSNTALKFSPVVAEDRRIDLSIQNDEAVIKLSEWTEGLGWCTQKTMKLDATLLGEMHTLIAAARCRLRSANHEERSETKVLKFPEFS